MSAYDAAMAWRAAPSANTTEEHAAHTVICDLMHEHSALTREVERLRAEVAAADKAGFEVSAEVERLRAEVDEQKARVDELDRNWWQANSDIRAANERAEAVTAVARGLRDACQAVEDGKPTDPAFPTEWDQVRAALARAKELGL